MSRAPYNRNVRQRRGTGSTTNEENDLNSTEPVLASSNANAGAQEIRIAANIELARGNTSDDEEESDQDDENEANGMTLEMITGIANETTAASNRNEGNYYEYCLSMSSQRDHRWQRSCSHNRR